jgi:hypothetical protein
MSNQDFEQANTFLQYLEEKAENAGLKLPHPSIDIIDRNQLRLSWYFPHAQVIIRFMPSRWSFDILDTGTFATASLIGFSYNEFLNLFQPYEHFLFKELYD